MHGKEFTYAKKSLHIFSHTNKFRIVMVWITEWSIFDNIVIAFIFLGTASMVVQDFEDPYGHTEKNRILFKIMEVISIFFIFEATMKTIAQGLI